MTVLRDIPWPYDTISSGFHFFFFFSVFFFRESFASFTRGTRGIPCKVQPPSARYPRRQNPEEASGAEKNCQTVVTSATVCRWLMAVIFLRIRMTQGSVIQSSLYINTDPPTCVCVCTCAWWMFLLLQHPEPTRQELSIVELAQIFDLLPGNCNFTTMPPTTSLVYHFLSTVSVDRPFDSNNGRTSASLEQQDAVN